MEEKHDLNEGEAEKYFSQGYRYEKEKKFAEARESYKKAAELGSARGWTYLGILLFEGNGGKEDKPQAYECFRRASDAGHLRGRFSLARMLARGEGVKQDVPEALRLFKSLLEDKYEGAQEQYDKLKAAYPHIELPETEFQKVKSNPHLQGTIQFIPRDQLELGKIIGSGAFGDVYQGKWQGDYVAIKKLRVSAVVARDLEKEFISEAAMLYRLNSPRIVRLLGITLQPEYSMTMEYVALGSLNSLMKKQTLSWSIRINQLGVDIGLGLGYLHEKEVLHRDLKAANVLVTHDLRAKLGDFGLAKLRKDQNTTAINVNPLAMGSTFWLSKDILDGKGKVKHTQKSDVYSYGVVLWELANAKEPGSVAEIDDIPKNTPEILRQEILKCRSANPQARPTAYQVANALKLYNGELDGTETEVSPSSSLSSSASSFPSGQPVGYVDVMDSDVAAAYVGNSELVYSTVNLEGESSASKLAKFRLKELPVPPQSGEKDQDEKKSGLARCSGK